jgi:hypothetical protein
MRVDVKLPAGWEAPPGIPETGLEMFAIEIPVTGATDAWMRRTIALCVHIVLSTHPQSSVQIKAFFPELLLK